MPIYSKKIIRFIENIKQMIEKILSKELGLKVLRGRFYDSKQAFSYPIKVVLFNDKKMLGYFDPNFYELGFHETLMLSSEKQLEAIVKHELAHYMTFVEYGENILPHGTEFQTFCRLHKWGEEVSKATICLEIESKESQESAILRKIKKLIALGSSSNAYEAEQAMIKSQQLLLKHHLDTHSIPDETDEKILLKRVLQSKRLNTKMRAIGKILNTFFISVVFNKGKNFIYLELVGDPAAVEIGEYVSHVLNRELDTLWEKAQKSHGLKGSRAKNSFFLGLAKGYCNQIDSLKKRSEIPALMVIEKRLKQSTDLIYGRLSKSSTSSFHCPISSSIGEETGGKLNIRAAIPQDNFKKILSISMLDK